MEGEIKNNGVIDRVRKSEICRFYLRGLCIKKSADCHFAHGVWDLHFNTYVDGEPIIYDYSKLQNDEKYEKLIKGPRNYINLYQFQTQKIFSLEELNADSAKRRFIRNQMHSQMFNEFMDLLQCYYPDANFSEEFLIRQFSRVGFNKTMSAIKLTHITSYVCDPPSSRFYMLTIIMPPSQKKQTNFLIPLATQQQTQQYYKQEYEDFLEKNKEKELNQNEIKRNMFSLCRPSLSLMPLNLFLKKKKMNFNNFLKSISGDGLGLIDETDEATLFESAREFIDFKAKELGVCSWNDVYKYLGTKHKVNNANITNPIKPMLVKEGYYFLNFPMIQLVCPKQRLFNWNKSERTCDCPYNKMYQFEQLLIPKMNIEQIEAMFPPKQSLDIYDFETLVKCAPAILSSKILGVDLQGRLRKGGYIEMIQLNTGRNTFLIDVYWMLQNAEFDAFELTKKIMRNIMCDHKILKIFHDCRHDSLALHEVMNTCIVNIFDTSAVETLRGQLEVFETQKENPKAILKTVANVKTSGLNEILKKYHAPHGINKNKDWFHQLWKKGKTQLFQMRPMNPQYREYCIKDVLDLPHVYRQMSDTLCPNFTDWISSYYVRQGFIYLSQQK